MLDAAFIHNPEGSVPHAHAPTLVESAGELLAAWYAYPEVEYEHAMLMLARRSCGAAEWTRGKRIFEHMQNSLGNPVLFVDPDGRLRLLFVALRGQYWNDAVLHGAHSDDGGETWSASTQLWPSRGLMVRHPPLVLGDGSLLLPAYDEHRREALLLRSLSPFRSWNIQHRFTGLALIQPALIRERAHRLTLFFRPAEAPRLIWRSHSADDGTSWSDPVPTALPTALSGMAAFSLGGTIGLVYNHTEAHQRFPLSLARSSDGGVTWSAPHHFDTATFELSYPSVVVAADGGIHGVYTYNRRFIKYVHFDAAWVHSGNDR
jgi:predicted neuraminidase